MYNNAKAPPADASQKDINDWRWKAAQFEKKVRICGSQAEGSPLERSGLRPQIAGLTAKYGNKALWWTFAPRAAASSRAASRR